MSLENIIIFYFCYFPNFSTNKVNLYKNIDYPGTKLVGVVFEPKKRMKNSQSRDHVLHKAFNLAISCCCFAVKDGKDNNVQNIKGMCIGIVFPH